MHGLQVPDSSQQMIDDICRLFNINPKQAIMLYRLGECDGIIATLSTTSKKPEVSHAL